MAKVINVLDYIGKTFGKLTVLREALPTERNRSQKGVQLIVNCDCGSGREFPLPPSRLAGKNIQKSCGCLNKVHDLTSMKFSKLTPIEVDTSHKGKYVKWICKCDCGNISSVLAGSLRSGNTQSCGCFNKQRITETHLTHGYTKKENKKLYHTWLNIKNRCNNPNHDSYCDYGAKGVCLQKDLNESFIAFAEAVGEPPENLKSWSIDRIDFNKGYEIGNMRWATSEQQGRNKGMNSRNTSGVTGVGWYVMDNGGTKAMAHWNNLDRKLGTKSFSVKKYGLIPAFKMAFMYRKEQIEKLNKAGAGYTEIHGTKGTL